VARDESSPENVAAFLVASGGIDVSPDEVAPRIDAANDRERPSVEGCPMKTSCSRHVIMAFQNASDSSVPSRMDEGFR